MEKYAPIRWRRARYGSTPESLHRLLMNQSKGTNVTVADEIEADPDNPLEKQIDGDHTSFPIRYRWTAQPDRSEGEYIVEEHIYVPHFVWILAILAPLYVAGLQALTAGLGLTSIADAAMVVFFPMSLLSGILLVVSMDFSEELLLDSAGEMTVTGSGDVPAFVLVPAVILLFGRMIVFPSEQLLVAATGVLLIGLSLASGTYERFVAMSEWVDSNLTFPAPAKEFLQVELVAITVLCAALLLFARLPAEMYEAGMAMDVLQVTSIVAVGVTLFELRYIQNVFHVTGHHMLETRKRQTENIRSHLGVLALCGLLGYSLLALVALYSGNPFSVSPSQRAAPLYHLSLAAILSLVLYLFTGIVMQTVSFVVDVATTFRSTERLDTSATEGIEPPVYVTHDRETTMSAYDDGFRTGIFVSPDVVEALTSKQLTALLRHEEAHVTEYNDSLLSFLAPILALGLLTGRNVIFAAFDFQEREKRADDYAARKAGVEPLREALKKVAEMQDDKERSSRSRIMGPTFTPVVPHSYQSTLLQFYAVFYGSFALSGLHPDANERRARLVQSENERDERNG